MAEQTKRPEPLPAWLKQRTGKYPDMKGRVIYQNTARRTQYVQTDSRLQPLVHFIGFTYIENARVGSTVLLTYHVENVSGSVMGFWRGRVTEY